MSTSTYIRPNWYRPFFAVIALAIVVTLTRGGDTQLVNPAQANKPCTEAEKALGNDCPADDETTDDTTDTTKKDDAADTTTTTNAGTATTVPEKEDVVEKKDGETVPKGTLAVTRVVNGKAVKIFGGKLQEDFKVDKNGNPARTAWVGFISEASACKAAKTEVDRSKASSSFDASQVTLDPPCGGTTGGTSTNSSTSTTSSTTSTTVLANLGGPPQTGDRFTGECSNVRRTDSQVRPVDMGATVPAGTLVQLKQVDNAGKAIYIEVGCLKTDLRAKKGLVAYDMWTNYGSVAAAYAAACGEALGMVDDSKVSGSWNAHYDVTLAGRGANDPFGPVPGTCPN